MSWKALFQRQRHEKDLSDELDSWLAEAEEDYLRQGLSAAEARRKARVALGGKAQVSEQVRHRWRGWSIFEWLVDVRYSWRMLRRRPLFASVIVATLALGIGANAAVFTMMHAVLIQPLPYLQPDRLALVWFGYDDAGQSRNPASGPELADLRQRSRLFEDFGAIWSSTGALTGDGDPEQVRIGYVSANFFDVLGAQPSTGRGFVREEEGAGEQGVQAIVLSDGLFRRRYAGDPSIIGRDILFDGWPATVVGVLPPGFELRFPSGSGVPSALQAFIAFPWEIERSDRGTSFLRVLGRLRPDASLVEAQDELSIIAGQMRSEHARYQELGLSLDVIDLQEDAVRHLRPALLALYAGVVLVLWIACVNVATLTLSRLGERSSEITVRVALGAGRLRLGRQLMIESLTLSFLGGAAGMGLGVLMLRTLPAWLPNGLTELGKLEMSWASVGYGIVLAVGSGVLLGLIPIWRTSQSSSLRERIGSGARRGSWLGHTLVIAEIALSTVLVIGAGLLLRTLVDSLRGDAGFRADQTLSFQVSLPRSRYPDDDARSSLARRIEEAIEQSPGVEAVGASSHLPLDDYPNWYGFVYPPGASAQAQNSLMADQRAATPGYLAALGAEIQTGRWIDGSDRAESRPVAVIDEVLAEQVWPEESAVGRQLYVDAWDNGDFVTRMVEVIGVVGHIHSHDLVRRLRGQVYLPHTQGGRPVLSWVVRGERATGELAQLAVGAVHELDPDLPLAKLRPLGDYVTQAAATERLTSALSVLFAALATLLAALGVYGVGASNVQQRTREIGIRLALGARAGEILRSVVAQGLMLALGGLALGVAGALLSGRLLRSVLHGVEPTDPATFVASIAFLLIASVAASYPAARRAARVDPLRSLRSE